MILVGIDGAEYKTNRTFTDLTGLVFGRLTVLGISKKIGYNYYYQCKCSCGTVCEVCKRDLVVGDTKSCGCLKLESSTITKFTEKYTTHGLSKTKEYRAWKRVKGRVFNPNNTDYSTYSKLGMESEWVDNFEAFLKDIGNIPDDVTRWSVGRIDNDVGYYKGNVRWESDDQQSKNKGKYKNNKTGITGVYVMKLHGVEKSVVASWYELDKKQHQKTFSINKYGMEGALKLADEYRELRIKELIEQGAFYTDKHGK